MISTAILYAVADASIWLVNKIITQTMTRPQLPENASISMRFMFSDANRLAYIQSTGRMLRGKAKIHIIYDSY